MKKFKYPLQIFPRDLSLRTDYQCLHEAKYEATFFGNMCQKYGYRSSSLTFAKLVEHIAMPQRKAVFWDSEDPEDKKWEKACQKAFAPCVYKESRRLGEKVEYFTAMVWDVDCGKASYDDVLEKMQAYGIQFIMYTSYSHKPEHHKFRVVLPSHKPIPVAYHKAFEEVAIQMFLDVSGEFIDLQAIGNKASTYNCAYLTPHYRGDWYDGGETHHRIDLFNMVQDKFEQIQRRKSFDFLDQQFSSSSTRTRHPCHIDDKQDKIARLNTDKDVRSEFASFIGARKRGSYWEKWECPDCKKSDATSFHEAHGRAFCNHNSSCGGSWLLPELARIKGWFN